MDRQARKLQTVRDEGGFGEETYPDASDEDEKEARNDFTITSYHFFPHPFEVL